MHRYLIRKDTALAVLAMELDHAVANFKKNTGTEAWKRLSQAMYAYQWAFGKTEDVINSKLCDVGVGRWPEYIAEKIVCVENV